MTVSSKYMGMGEQWQPADRLELEGVEGRYHSHTVFDVRFCSVACGRGYSFYLGGHLIETSTMGD